MKLSVSLCSRAGFTETRIILDRRKNWAENPPTIPGENQPTVPGENPPAIPGENPPTVPGENPPTVPGENPPDSADPLRKGCRGTQVQYIYSICTTIHVYSIQCCHGYNFTGLSRRQ